VDSREWVSFADTEEDRTWLFDLTGRAPELELGCCSYGAHLTGEEDARRVEEVAEHLGPHAWQFRARALRRVRGNGAAPGGGTSEAGGGGRGGAAAWGERLGPLRRAPGQPTTTRLVEDACIFLNRPGFPGGAGCALHLAALADGVAPMSYKPDVCWQLPLRREDEVESGGHVVSRVTQWERRHWGPAGGEFAWWCSEDPAAYGATQPLYQRMDAELRAVCGDEVIDLLVEYLATRYDEAGTEVARAATTAGLPPGSAPLPHPVVRSR